MGSQRGRHDLVIEQQQQAELEDFIARGLPVTDRIGNWMLILQRQQENNCPP